METPYLLRLKGGPPVQTVGKFPAHLGKPLSYARPEITKNDQASFVRQLFVGTSIFIELCSCKVTVSGATIIASLERPALLFCYLLRGDGITLKNDGKTLTTLLNGQYAGIYLPAGEYGLSFSKGRHLMMNFAFPSGFLKSLTNNCPRLSVLVHSLRSSSTRPEVAKPGKMDDKIKQLLTKMQNIRKSGRLTEAMLMSPVAELLWRYEFRLQEGEHKTEKSGREKAYDAKAYIDDHYTHPDCQVNQLVSRFNLTRRTLSREFKRAFGISVQDYIIQLRMQLAGKLLEEGRRVNQVSTTIGYENVVSFSRTFKRHYGYPPAQKKIKRRPN